jgi:hypothetical protein
VTLKRLLLSRGTVLAIIGGLTALITLASLVPQGFMTPADELVRWRAAHPLLGAVVVALGLGHVYTHPAFTGLLVLAVTALVLSAVEQLRIAVRRTFPRAPPSAAGAPLEVCAPVESVARALRSRGFVELRHPAGGRFLVRHPWGHWGIFLLHAGLVTVVSSSAFIGVTQQRATLHLVEGETHGRGGPWFAEEYGLAATRLVLPFSVTLDHLEYRFWPTHGLERVTSTLSLRQPGRPPETVRVSISDLQLVDGIRIYQGSELGHAFEVTIDGERPGTPITLLVPHPATPEEAGRNEFRVLPGDDVLQAKYFVDAERRSFDVLNPVLHLRVERHGASLGEATLRPGTSGAIGPYAFRLERVRVWTRLFFVRLSGIAGVFVGFLVIALGGALHFFTPPREAWLAPSGPATTHLFWRAARFPAFYAEELDAIRAGLGKGVPR